MSGTNVFESTESLDGSLVDIIDLTKLLAAGLWTLRSDIVSYRKRWPNKNVQDLDRRFLAGSDVQFRNLPIVLVQTWPEQHNRIAEVALLAAFGLFEGWLAELAAHFPSVNERRLTSALQNPPATASISPSPPDGIDLGISWMTANPPQYPAAMNAIGNAARMRRTYAGTILANLMVAFRAYKELRNCIAHRGRKVDALAADWCLAAGRLGRQDVGLRRRPLDMAGKTIGQPVTLTIEDVVGVVAILRKIATTIDANVAVSAEAEAEVLRRFPGTTARPHIVTTGNWSRHLRNVLRGQAKVPAPGDASIADVVSMLKAERLVRAS